jgi:hypothetical protein
LFYRPLVVSDDLIHDAFRLKVYGLLDQARRDAYSILHPRAPRRRSLDGGCVGCGCRLDHGTPGCRNCRSRHEMRRLAGKPHVDPLTLGSGTRRGPKTKRLRIQCVAVSRPRLRGRPIEALVDDKTGTVAVTFQSGQKRVYTREEIADYTVQAARMANTGTCPESWWELLEGIVGRDVMRATLEAVKEFEDEPTPPGLVLQ